MGDFTVRHFATFGISRPATRLHYKKLLFTSSVLVITTLVALAIQYRLTPKRETTVAAQPTVATAPATATPVMHAAGGNLAVKTSVKSAAIPTCTPAIAPTLSPSTTGLAPGVHTVISEPTYYLVYGDNLDQIRQHLHTCGPQIDNTRHDAITTYAANWEYKYQPLGDDPTLCAISEPVIAMQIVQVLPNWQTSKSAPKSIATSWQAYSNNLRMHENGHANLDAAAATTLYNTLIAMPPTPCSETSKVAEKTIQNVLNQLNSANNSYDDHTGHGATQGANL